MVVGGESYCNSLNMTFKLRQVLVGIAVSSLFITVLNQTIFNQLFSDYDRLPKFFYWLADLMHWVFLNLCLIFRIDFVSNYYPEEGPLRPILLNIFGWLSPYIVIFLLSLTVYFILKVILRTGSKAS